MTVSEAMYLECMFDGRLFVAVHETDLGNVFREHVRRQIFFSQLREKLRTAVEKPQPLAILMTNSGKIKVPAFMRRGLPETANGQLACDVDSVYLSH